MEPTLVILGIIIFIILFLISNIKIVPQAHEYVIQRMGTYLTTWKAGIHFLVPFIDKVANKISVKEHVVDFKPQPVITKDNVTMQIDTVVFFQVTDSKLYTYGVQNPLMAIENLSATTLRNIIGEMELDSTLTSRDVINTRITAILDVATDKWGIKINRVELKNILPPREIQDAMEKQMKAERERRESILQAEGKKKSQILVAEGEKQSKILEAEAHKQAEILRAEAEKQALILHAEAVREQKIREAEGEAEAIQKVQKALADSIELLNQANPNDAVIALKSLEAFQKAADGKSTKIIIPSQIQGVAGLATSVKELISDKNIASE
ncbi:MAG: SPFH domain-containing protein [Oscillospiraceae bacterium]